MSLGFPGANSATVFPATRHKVNEPVQAWGVGRREHIHKATPTSSLRLPEILIKQECQANAGQQQLMPHDAERPVAIGQDVGVLEVRTFLEVIERNRDGEGVIQYPRRARGGGWHVRSRDVPCRS